MKVLLTGATGFLGKNLKSVLDIHHDVVGVGSLQCDLTNQLEVSRMFDLSIPDAVVHAAGVVGGIGANKENPGRFMYENLVMGANLLHESMLRGVAKFVQIGTVCSYPKYTEVPFREENLWNGYPEETNAPYGVAKRALMEMSIAYHRQYQMNVTNLLPVNMYGPYDHFNLTSSHVIPALVLKVHNALKEGQKSITLWGTGQASREFLFVEDCAEAIRLSLEKDTTPDPINIGTGKEVKICELAYLICELMSFDGEIIWDDSKPDGQPRRCLDVSKAKDVLGFQAKTDLLLGLKNTIQFFKDGL